jgi:ABC-type polar amino acid transport system ATPase subunit
MRVMVEAVSKAFVDRRGRSVEALRDVSLVIENGEFITVLGPSGCGKSTLLHILPGLLPPTRGRVTFEGAREGQPLSAIVFQEHALFPWRTAAGNIGFGLEVRAVPAREREARVAALVELVGLGGFEHRYPRELSGGMRQRVAIARALAIPVVINTYAGVRDTDPVMVKAAVSLGAARVQTVFKVLLPSALPMILAGYRLGAGIGLLLVVSAEMINATTGIGFLILNSGDLMLTGRLMVGLVVLSLLGLGTTWALRFLEARLVPWREDFRV